MQYALFQKHLAGKGYRSLPDVVKQTHEFNEQIVLSGLAEVEHGNGFMVSLIRLLFRFPKSGKSQSLQVIKQRNELGEIWTRTFSGQSFKSELSRTKHGLTERFGVLRFVLDLKVLDGELHYAVSRAHIFGIPWPTKLLPVSVAKEYALGEQFHFDVALYAPLSKGLIVHYRGFLHVEG